MIKYQSKNLNKDKERIYTVWHGKEGKNGFSRKFYLFIRRFRDTSKYPFSHKSSNSRIPPI